MSQMSTETPFKYKRRKVSAIRHFPRGCGHNNTVKLSPKPAEETSSPVGLENGKVTDTDMVLVASKVVEETIAPPPLVLEEKAMDVPASVEALIPEVAEPPISSTPVVLENNVEGDPKTEELEVQQVMENIDVMENNVESNPETGKLEVQQLMDVSVEPPKLQNRHCHSKMYGFPMRRKVSAIRQFPPRCGPNTGIIKKDNHQPVCAAPNYLSDKSLVGEKIYEVNTHLVGDGSMGVVDGEVLGGEMRRNDGKVLVQENDQGISSEPIIRPQITSPKSKTVYGDKKPVLQQQSMLIDGSLQVADVENSLNRGKSMMKQAATIAGSVKVSSSEKVGVVDRKDSKITKGKEITIDKSFLVRSNSDKNFRVQGTSGHDQSKSSLKSGSNGESLLKCRSNELSVRSSFDKTLEGRKVDQAVRNFQTKANTSKPLHLVVKSHSGNERLDERGMPLMEKHVGKENEIDQNSSKKRKLPAEIPYNDYIPGERDDSLADIGERMIIQALMAGKNCPWRHPRRRSVVSSDFIVPKSNIRKEKRFVKKNPASKDLFSSQQKGKRLIEDDDDTLEEENELSITMTPFVPRESIHKGGDNEEVFHKGGDNEEVMVRHKVKRALRLFQLICRKLLQGEESRSKRLGKSNRIDLQASAMLKDNGEWVNSGDPIIGHVPGVEIGDEFHFRVELSIVGLHRPFQGGIDCTKKNGMLLATSIVASGGYQDDMDSSDVLIYSGSGGTSVVGRDKQPSDQKLERGNLALKNSIDAQTPVRVIHGFKEKGSDPYDAKGKIVSTFTYDGLYQVESYWQEIGNHGFNVFKFQLRRKAGQPELALKELKRSAKLKIREGLCVKDISQGKEKIPISVVNTIDTDQPMPFKYITKSIYPSWYVKTPPRGCDCTNGCSDSEKCACAVKNGGEIPFNFNGAIVQAKPLIYECGPSCKCSVSCHNRVSQRGIRMQLEIFKTRGRGWGVRSLKSISSGSFICEYIGELLRDGDAEQRTNDEYLFDIGHNYDDRSLWEDLPNLIPGLQSSSQCDTVESVGFTIDAAEYGNVGRFINHSCSPNLYAQNVLYDHDDKRMPHIMFFAVDNIPPLQELTYHYNYTIDQVHDSEGNIKQKACHCGSPECCGRLY